MSVEAPIVHGSISVSSLTVASAVELSDGSTITAIENTLHATSTNPITSSAVYTALNNIVGSTGVTANTNANLIADGTVSNDEFQYLSGVTSALQTQLDAKQPSGSYLTTLPSQINVNLIADGTVNNTELQYLSGVTSSIQTQLDNLAALSTSASGASSGLHINHWLQVGDDILGQFSNKQVWTTLMNNDGTIVLLASPFASAVGNNGDHGGVSVYKLSNNVWTQMGANILGENAGDQMTHTNSVAMSADGTIVAVGTEKYDTDVTNAGRARVFQYSEASDSWTQLGADLVGDSNSPGLGLSMSLNDDGTILALGKTGTNSRGGVHIFQYQNGAWTEMGAGILTDTHGERLGYQIALNSAGTRIVVAAGQIYGTKYGTISVYEYQSNSWTQLGATIDGEAGRDYFGSGLAINSDGTIIAGCSKGVYHDEYVKVFQYNNDILDWELMGPRLEVATRSAVVSGRLSLSADGKILAVGSSSNDSSNGQVRVFYYQNDIWHQIGAEFNGESNDEFGMSVDLNSDGTRLVIVERNNTGRAVVYQLYGV